MSAEPPGRVLGIDYGSRRVGVAVSDPLRVLAGPLAALTNDGALIDRICALAAAEEASLVLVGMPYAADGGKGRKAQEVDEFITRLRARLPVPIATWDESYTSVDAHRAFRAGGMKRKRREEKARVDVMAARLLLQEYLDHLRAIPTTIPDSRDRQGRPPEVQ